jgi:quercetin dioxygenase-like cupin family protein
MSSAPPRWRGGVWPKCSNDCAATAAFRSTTWAARSGVSRAALSQIEGARTNPTLAVLWKIAVGLDVPFHDLWGSNDDSSVRVLRAGDTTPLRSADGRMESRLLSPGGSNVNVEVFDLRFQPKAVHRSDPHGRGTTETLVVLTGSLRLLVDGSEHELLTGDSVFFRADVPHVYENRTEAASTSASRHFLGRSRRTQRAR